MSYIGGVGRAPKYLHTYIGGVGRAPEYLHTYKFMLKHKINNAIKTHGQICNKKTESKCFEF